MVGPDALKWSWVMLGLGLLMLADGYWNWGIFQSNDRRDPLTYQLPKYGTVRRFARMIAGSVFATVGAVGLGYLAWARLHP